MTAQVVIFTSSFAVLAADSAVTVSGGAADRVYNGVEKLVPLAADAPVAAMIYGAATIGDVPWGTLLHAFAAERDVAGMSVVEITEALQEFVKQRMEGHLATHAEDLRASRVHEAFRHLADLAHSDIGEGIAAESYAVEWVRAVDTIIASEVREWESQPLVSGLDERSESELHEAYRAWACSLTNELFEGTDAPTRLRATTADLVLWWFTRRQPRGTRTARGGGIVVAGFGANEFWPGCCVLEFDGIGFDGPRMWPGEESTAAGPRDPRVLAFAQRSGVFTLLNGMHPLMLPVLESKMAAEGLSEEVATAVLEGAVLTWNESRTSDVLRTLDLLPAPALCEIAESLVALTGLEHRLTGSLETVGGTISVGVLAPGEPLRWAKRPSLMPA